MFGGLFGQTATAGQTINLAFDSSASPKTAAPDPSNENVSPCSLTGNMQAFYVVLGTAQPASGALDCIITLNGVDTTLAVTIPAGSGAGIYADIVHQVPVVAGDYLSFKMVNHALAASGQVANFSMLIG